MRKLTYFIFTTLCICVILACDINQSEMEFEKEIKASERIAFDTYLDKDKNSVETLDFRGRNWIVIPFEGSFFTTPKGNPMPDQRCAAPALLDTQKGHGKAIHLGPFSFNSTFCIDLSDLLPPLGGDGKLTEGEALPFYGSVTTFTFANGDKLYARGNSAVLPTDKADYNAEFSNPFVFVGGTGRFKNAKGGGTTTSLVTFGVGTDHEFSGVIVLSKKRGRKDR